jgi:hypothetical protein
MFPNIHRADLMPCIIDFSMLLLRGLLDDPTDGHDAIAFHLCFVFLSLLSSFAQFQQSSGVDISEYRLIYSNYQVSMISVTLLITLQSKLSYVVNSDAMYIYRTTCDAETQTKPLDVGTSVVPGSDTNLQVHMK